MKKGVFLFAAAAVLILAGCQHNSGQRTEPEIQPPPTQAENAGLDAVAFRSGIWFVSGKD